MRDPDDGGERRPVRVMDHHRTAFGVEPLAQPGRIAGERERADGSWLHDPTAEQELPTGRAPQPAGDDGQPLHDLAATDADERERGADQQDRDDVHQRRAAADVQREDEGDRAEADDDELRSRQAEQYPASSESGELHGRQLEVTQSWCWCSSVSPSWLATGWGRRRPTCGGTGGACGRRRLARGVGLRRGCCSDRVPSSGARLDGLLRHDHTASDDATRGGCSARRAATGGTRPTPRPLPPSARDQRV